jgi:hypothetical protein
MPLNSVIQPVLLDYSQSSIPNRYEQSFLALGSITNTLVASFGKALSGNPDLLVYRIRVIEGMVAAGTGQVLEIHRATGAAGGNVVVPGDVHKKDSSIGNATAECRTGNITTATEILSGGMMALGGSPSTTAGTSSPESLWQAFDRSDMIRLTGIEAIVFAQSVISNDVDNRYWITIAWEEL